MVRENCKECTRSASTDDCSYGGGPSNSVSCTLVSSKYFFCAHLYKFCLSKQLESLLFCWVALGACLLLHYFNIACSSFVLIAPSRYMWNPSKSLRPPSQINNTIEPTPAAVLTFILSTPSLPLFLLLSGGCATLVVVVSVMPSGWLLKLPRASSSYSRCNGDEGGSLRPGQGRGR